MWNKKATGVKKQSVENVTACFVLVMLSCSVLFPPALTKHVSELPFPVPSYSPTHKYIVSSEQVLPATDFPARAKGAPLHITF